MEFWSGFAWGACAASLFFGIPVVLVLHMVRGTLDGISDVLRALGKKL